MLNTTFGSSLDWDVFSSNDVYIYKVVGFENKKNAVAMRAAL